MKVCHGLAQAVFLVLVTASTGCTNPWHTVPHTPDS